jgi:hypothetical protein
LGDAPLSRADLLDDILYALDLNRGFGTLITVFCPSDKGRCSLKKEVRRAAVAWIFWRLSIDEASEVVDYDSRMWSGELKAQKSLDR